MKELETLRIELIDAHAELDKIREYTESIEARMDFVIKSERSKDLEQYQANKTKF